MKPAGQRACPHKVKYVKTATSGLTARKTKRGTEKYTEIHRDTQRHTHGRMGGGAFRYEDRHVVKPPDGHEKETDKQPKQTDAIRFLSHTFIHR